MKQEIYDLRADRDKVKEDNKKLSQRAIGYQRQIQMLEQV